MEEKDKPNNLCETCGEPVPEDMAPIAIYINTPDGEEKHEVLRCQRCLDDIKIYLGVQCTYGKTRLIEKIAKLEIQRDNTEDRDDYADLDIAIDNWKWSFYLEFGHPYEIEKAIYDKQRKEDEKRD